MSKKNDIGKKRKEVRAKKEPFIQNWDMRVYDDAEDYAKILCAFAEFWQEGGAYLEMPYGIVLRGNVHGHRGFVDGVRIDTCYLKNIERIKQQCCDGVQRDLMCATTIAGDKFYFYGDGCLPEVGLTLRRLIRNV